MRPSEPLSVRLFILFMVSLISSALLCVVPAGAQCIDWAGHLDEQGAVRLPAGREVAVEGDYAYVSGARLRVVDLSNADAPVVILEDAGVGTVYGIAISDGYLYAASDLFGLAVLSLANPAAPALVGSVNPPGYGWGVCASGNFVYMSTSSALQVIDVSNPASPHLEGSVQVPGPVRGVAKRGSYVYAATGGGVQAISVVNPASPYLSGLCPTPADCFAVTIWEDRLWVTMGQEVGEISLATPTAPVLRDTYGSRFYVYGIASAEGQVWFVGGVEDEELDLNYGVLQILDTTTPGSMQLQASIGLQFSCVGLALRQPMAFVCSIAGEGLFHLIDGTNPVTPPVLGSATAYGPAEVIVEGSLAYTGGQDRSLKIYDISDPSMPDLLGSAHVDWNIGGLALYHAGGETYACAAEPYYPNEMEILRVTDSSWPQVVASLQMPGYPFEIAVQGSYAYVADGTDGLRIVDLTNPATPQIVGHCAVPGTAHDIVVRDSYAYVAVISFGLVVIDVSDPSAPAVVGSFEPPYGYFMGVDLADSIVYLTSESTGIYVIRVADPTAPELLRTIPTLPHGSETRVHGGIAYFVSTQGGLQVFDVGNPWSPVELGRLWSGGADAVAPGDEVVCLAGEHLKIVSAQCASADAGDPISGGPATALSVVPNPTSGSATIRWQPRAGGADAPVELEIYNPAGQIVRCLRATGVAGPEILWDGTDQAGRRLPQGIYLVRGRAGEETWRGRIVRID
ncbi:MAG: hypothetical protein ACE15D_17235 [Candidatus Eisenbacteria bacterium]